MKYLLTFVFFFVLSVFSAGAQSLDSHFVDEKTMKKNLMQMLVGFSQYAKNDYENIDSVYGCFRGENTMGSDERGVRTNADLSMVCAFLCRYGSRQVPLPAGVTWNDLETMARKSLAFAVATHKAIRLHPCSDGHYWGSLDKNDYTWESSLWSLSVAYSAFFQWKELTAKERENVYQLLKAECNYELERNIPTNYIGDTKAEENGWEADVLAVTLGLFPHDALAPRWFHRMREFAVNSYSHPSDTSSLYHGQNLYSDYTLQNHNFFHTSYQNVVIQELGEAALALRMFQKNDRWKTDDLYHNCSKVTTQVLDWLSLPDGEQAMPNGNDWSLFLYDQITSYSVMACMLHNPDALMLENQAYKQIRTRQRTTEDGSWLLRADVGARRMGVEAHRVMMTWLMHEYFPTRKMAPSSWTDFLKRHETARLFKCQNVVRAASEDRFTCFSWSRGKRSYTGYIAPFHLRDNNLVVPFRVHNTGNFLGFYTVEGCKTDARPVVSGIYQLKGNGYVMNGELNTNDSALNHRFSLYSAPGNAVIYLDDVRANRDCRILKEQGGLMAVSTDDFTRRKRTLSTTDGTRVCDGSRLNVLHGGWLNIDHTFGVVCGDHKDMAFGDRNNNNSIMTSKIYAAYSNEVRDVHRHETVDARHIVWYSNVSDSVTRALYAELQCLSSLPEGWNGVLAADPDGTRYFLLSNFSSPDSVCTVHVECPEYGAPVFPVPAVIHRSVSSVSFMVTENHSVSAEIRCFVQGTGVQAVQNTQGEVEVWNISGRSQPVTIVRMISGGLRKQTCIIGKGERIKVS